MASLDELDDVWSIDEDPEDILDLEEDISPVRNAFVGHGGVKATIAKLHKKGINFPKMREQVDAFIKKCPFCQKQNYRKVKITTTPFTVAAYKSMQRLNIDTIGPLPEDEEGCVYIIVIVDCFSR